MAGQVLVRLPAETVALLDAAAAAEGISTASWARARLVMALDADPAEAVPVLRVKAPRPEWMRDLDRARETAAELTGVLVRAAGLSRQAGDQASHIEIESLIPGTRRAAREAARTIRQVCQHLDRQLPR